jgi:hypothetical protein
MAGMHAGMMGMVSRGMNGVRKADLYEGGVGSGRRAGSKPGADAAAAAAVAQVCSSPCMIRY